MPVQLGRPSSWWMQYEATHTASDKHLTAATPFPHIQPLTLQTKRSQRKKPTLLLFARFSLCPCSSLSETALLSYPLMLKGKLFLVFVFHKVPHSHQTDLKGVDQCVRSAIKYNLFVSALLWSLPLSIFFLITEQCLGNRKPDHNLMSLK